MVKTKFSSQYDESSSIHCELVNLYRLQLRAFIMFLTIGVLNLLVMLYIAVGLLGIPFVGVEAPVDPQDEQFRQETKALLQEGKKWDKDMEEARRKIRESLSN